MTGSNIDEPAFPAQSRERYFPGMSLRDHFAGLAMQGDLSAMQIDGRRFSFLIALAESEGITMARAIANEAYEMADAMLAEREKKRGK